MMKFFLIHEIFTKHKNHIIPAFLILLMSLGISLRNSFVPKEEPPAPSVSEMIPKGFVLLPVQISNKEDLDGLMDSYGVLDLYSFSPETGRTGDRAASGLKVLVSGDSSDDSLRFAALIPGNQVSLFFEHQGPFYAVLQNPEKQGSQIYKKRIERKVTIISESLE